MDRELILTDVLAELDRCLVGTDVKDYVTRLAADLEYCATEVRRLRADIRKTAETMSIPLSDRLNPRVHSLPSRTTVRLEPQTYEVRIPIDASGWSEKHQRAFIDSVAELIGKKAGRALAKAVWPDLRLE